MSFEVLMLKSITPKPGEIQYKRLGAFNIALGAEAPANWELLFDYDSKSLFLFVLQYPVTDQAIGDSKVYSIVDFVPGIIAVGNSTYTPHTWHKDSGVDIQQIRSFMTALVTGIDMGDVTLSFAYPRAIQFHSYTSPFGDVAATKCQGKDGKYLALKTINDIDSQTDLTISPAKISEEEKKQICVAVLTPPPDEPIPTEPPAPKLP